MQDSLIAANSRASHRWIRAGDRQQLQARDQVPAKGAFASTESQSLAYGERKWHLTCINAIDRKASSSD